MTNAEAVDVLIVIGDFGAMQRLRPKKVSEALNKAIEALQQPEIIYCADCPKEDRKECEKQYGKVQNEWNCRFGRRYEKR